MSIGPISDISSIVLRQLSVSTSNAVINMEAIAYGKQEKSIENAANMIISESMESQKRGTAMANENAQSGSNMLQTADSDLSSINESLQRIRELSIQSQNGTLSEADRGAIQNEISGLTDHIDQVSGSSSFNDVKLLDGTSKDVSLQIGANSGDTKNLTGEKGVLSEVNTASLGITPGSNNFIDQIDKAISTVSSKRSAIGATQNGLESSITSLSIKEENIAAAQSNIRDVDIASESSKLVRNQILSNVSVSLLAQANQSPAFANMLL